MNNNSKQISGGGPQEHWPLWGGDALSAKRKKYILFKKHLLLTAHMPLK